jgi:thiol-disulfide isomerase/thioredoxin
MFRQAFLITILTFTLSGPAGAGGPMVSNPLSFLTSFDQARERALEEDKLILIEFYASWCMPCRWMASTTFNDPEVIALIDAHYIPLKADVDRIEGFKLFEKYAVTVLPTTLVLNTSGEIIGRYEESLGITQCLDILQTLHKHQGSAKKPIAKKETLEAPKVNVAVVPNTGPLMDPVSTASSTPKSADLPAAPKTGFSVQIGVYTLYPNVLSKHLEIQQLAATPSWLEETTVDKSTVFKLLSGHFKTRSEAEAWRAVLAQAQIPGYIRDLSRT